MASSAASYETATDPGHGLDVNTVDGSWFLVPAALLGSGKATARFATHLATLDASALAIPALVITLLSWGMYWPVAALAYQRIRRCGRGDGTQAPWWIGMGCAGLAAAALAQMVSLQLLPGLSQTLLIAAMAVTATVATALFVPVAFSSFVFMLKSCRYHAKAAWPPTFSTAVYAMGCTQSASVLHSTTFHRLGLAASVATLLFWLATAAWNALLHRPIARYLLLAVRRNREQ